jgi:hypothetical protein
VIRTPDQALARLRARPAMTLAALADEVAGERVRGSWWGHPAGKRIYAIASALEGSPDVWVVKLIDGKVTFVHRALAPALLRRVLDPGFRRQARAGLDAAARRLLARVERAGELRLDELAAGDRGAERALAAAAKELARRLLVATGSVHTDRGRHATVVRSWRRLASAAELAAARALARADAERALAEAGAEVPR